MSFMSKKNVLYLTKKQARNISAINNHVLLKTMQRFAPFDAGVAIAQNETNKNDR